MTKRKRKTKSDDGRPETILFLGDIHAGSHHAPWPEELLPSSSRFSAVRYLNECLAHLLESLPDSIDLLVLMGDLIDGEQRKSRGRGLFTTVLGEQAEGAIEVLRPFAAKARRIIRVEGTPYHESFHDVLRVVDAELGVVHASQVIDLRLGEHIMNIAHHPTGGSALYVGTKVDKESLWATIAAARGKVPDPLWIVRAHVHEFAIWETERKIVVQVPCWELPTGYAKKGAYWKWQPSLGAVLAYRDDRQHGGYAFEKKLYDVPQPTLTPWEEIA